MTPKKIYTIVKGRETFYPRHTVPVTSCSEVKYVLKRVSFGSKDLFVYLFTNSNAKPDVNGILFLIEPALKEFDSRRKGCEFEPHLRHCVVSLSKNINPSLVLVQPRNTHPFLTERLLMGRKESTQTHTQKNLSVS